jgi:DNA-directed RNA polymerase specialized sigma24 family protein
VDESVGEQEDERVSVPVDEREDADDVLADVADAGPADGLSGDPAAETAVTSYDRSAPHDALDGQDADAGYTGQDAHSEGTQVVPESPRRSTGSAVSLRADFGAHLEANYQRLVAQLYAITLDPGEAHDAVQDAYSRAWRKWATIGRSPDPSAWVRSVAVRSTARSWRRTLARIGIGRAKTIGEGVDPRTRALLAALGRLSPAERRVVVLFHMAGSSLEEIAAVERAGVGLVKARLARARSAVTEGMADVLPAVLGDRIDDGYGNTDLGADLDDYDPGRLVDGYGTGGYGTGGYALDPYGTGGYGDGYGYEPRDDGGERR